MSFVGSLSNIFGRSQLLFASVSLFTIGTIVCCTAHSIGSMLAGRSIQGVGGGGVIVLAQIIFTDIVPLRYRPKYLGIIQGAWALGTCLGPVLGGALAKPNLWRWVFYILLPFCGISLFLVPLTVRLDGRRKASLQNMLTRIDWIGGGLFVSSTASFLIGLSWGGNQYSWSSASTLVPLILGAVGMIATIVWERYCPFEPFLPASIFYNASAIIVYGGAFSQGFLVGGDPGRPVLHWLVGDLTNGFVTVVWAAILYCILFRFGPAQITTRHGCRADPTATDSDSQCDRCRGCHHSHSPVSMGHVVWVCNPQPLSRAVDHLRRQNKSLHLGPCLRAHRYRSWFGLERIACRLAFDSQTWPRGIRRSNLCLYA